MSNHSRTDGIHSVRRMSMRKRGQRHLVLGALGLAVAVMIPALVVPLSKASASTCSSSSPPNVCSVGLCTPWVGTAPVYDRNVCCNTTGTCYPAGRTGCGRGTTQYHCPYGEVDPASGIVRCYMELSLSPPTYEDDQFCCSISSGTCTIYTGSGCTGSDDLYIATCIGDVLIMDDGTAYCFPVGEC